MVIQLVKMHIILSFSINFEVFLVQNVQNFRATRDFNDFNDNYKFPRNLNCEKRRENGAEISFPQFGHWSIRIFGQNNNYVMFLRVW